MKIAPELVVPLKNDIESNLCTPSLYSRCMEFLKGVNENCTRASCSFEKIILNQIYAYHHYTVGLIFLHWCEAAVYIRCIQVFKGVKKNCTWACGSFGKIILIQISALNGKQHYTVGLI